MTPINILSLEIIFVKWILYEKEYDLSGLLNFYRQLLTTRKAYN